MEGARRAVRNDRREPPPRQNSRAGARLPSMIDTTCEKLAPSPTAAAFRPLTSNYLLLYQNAPPTIPVRRGDPVESTRTAAIRRKRSPSPEAVDCEENILAYLIVTTLAVVFATFVACVVVYGYPVLIVGALVGVGLAFVWLLALTADGLRGRDPGPIR